MAVFMLLQLAFVLVVGGWLLYRVNTKNDGRQLTDAQRRLTVATLLANRVESELNVQIAAGYYDPQPLIALFNDQKEPIS